MSQPQTGQPVQAQCAWCGTHTLCIPGNLGNGTAPWICQADYQVNSQYDPGSGQVVLTPPGWQRAAFTLLGEYLLSFRDVVVTDADEFDGTRQRDSQVDGQRGFSHAAFA